MHTIIIIYCFNPILKTHLQGYLRVTTYSSSFFVSSVRLSSKCQSSLACSEAGNPVGLTPKGVSWRRRVNCEAALQKVCGGWGEVRWEIPKIERFQFFFWRYAWEILVQTYETYDCVSVFLQLRASSLRRCFPRRCEVLLKTMRDTGNDDNPAKQLGWVGGKGRHWAACNTLQGEAEPHPRVHVNIESHGFLSKGKWSTNSNPLYGRMLIDWRVLGRLWLLWITNPQHDLKGDLAEIHRHFLKSWPQNRTGKTTKDSMSICFEYAATGWRPQLIFNDVPFSFQKRMEIVRGCGAGCMATPVRALSTVFLVEKWMIKLFKIEFVFFKLVRFSFYINLETKRDKPIFDGLRVVRWVIRM